MRLKWLAERPHDLKLTVPSALWWNEIARVLKPGGAYFAQHVGAFTSGN